MLFKRLKKLWELSNYEEAPLFSNQVFEIKPGTIIKTTIDEKGYIIKKKIEPIDLINNE